MRRSAPIFLAERDAWKSGLHSLSAFDFGESAYAGFTISADTILSRYPATQAAASFDVWRSNFGLVICSGIARPKRW